MNEKIINCTQFCGLEQNIWIFFLNELTSSPSKVFLQDDIKKLASQVEKKLKSNKIDHPKNLHSKMSSIRVAVNLDSDIYFYQREYQKMSKIYKTSSFGDTLYECNQQEWLYALESVKISKPQPNEFTFKIDFSPFRTFNQETLPEGRIGQGLEKIIDLIIKGIEDDPIHVIDNIINFLSDRSFGNLPLFFYSPSPNRDMLRKKITTIMKILDKKEDNVPFEEILNDMQLMGFAYGWGKNVESVKKSLSLLFKIITHPDKESIKEFFERLPLVRTAVLVTVHGYFAQEKVLGKPDTGGQIVYVLEQARAVERYLIKVWEEAGINGITPKIIILTRLIPNSEGTTCNHEQERVHGSKCCWIIRIPFRDKKGNIVKDWISRFKIWPYLDSYIKEASKTILGECEGKPDLIIGNYTDGSLVATAMGREWNVPTGIIAHALEKTKYELSDLNWKNMEENYNFSSHFLSDVLSINSADFIITSSMQEIAGTKEHMGQYESYETFSLPGLYRIFDGINIHSTRFVINPPGVNESEYFPYFEIHKRQPLIANQVKESLFGTDTIRNPVGKLKDPDKPAIFTMARMDKIKNITGLVKCYLKNEKLRQKCNLIIVSGYTDPENSKDIEEKSQIKTMHELLKKYDAYSNVRWLPGDGNRKRIPEYYRIIADLKGVFVQPALYEAFGLTVIEAMATGLPVIATQYGGPSEIIVNEKSGLLIDPKNHTKTSSAILRVIDNKDKKKNGLWESLSKGGLQRVEEMYNWEKYSIRMNTAASIYGFWNNLTPQIRKLRRNYIDSLYHLLLKSLANGKHEIVMDMDTKI